MTVESALVYPKVGIGYRRRLLREILEASGSIDCLELLVEHFLPLTPARRAELLMLREHFDLIPHGVSLSVASQEITDFPHLNDLKELIRLIEAPFFGEHLSMSRAAGFNLWHLSPVWRTRAQLRRTVDHIARTMEVLGVPFVLETITEMLCLANSDYAMDEFYELVCVQSGAELLLDVTNVWINQTNALSDLAIKPFGRLAECPWRQFHIVGYGLDHDGFIIDSHDSPIQPEIFNIYAQALAVQAPDYVILERDGGLFVEPTILAEVVKLREMARGIAAEPKRVAR